MAFVTSELERTEAGQDLPFSTSVRRQLDIWVLFTPGGLSKSLSGHRWFSTWLHIRLFGEAFKNHPTPRPITPGGGSRKPVSSLLPRQAVHTCRQGELLHESRSTARWFCFPSVPPGGGIFRKRHSDVSSKDAACCVERQLREAIWSAGCRGGSPCLGRVGIVSGFGGCPRPRRMPRCP